MAVSLAVPDMMSQPRIGSSCFCDKFHENRLELFEKSQRASPTNDRTNYCKTLYILAAS